MLLTSTRRSLLQASTKAVTISSNSSASSMISRRNFSLLTRCTSVISPHAPFSNSSIRFKSSSSAVAEDEEIVASPTGRRRRHDGPHNSYINEKGVREEIVTFPVSSEESHPVKLNSHEHAVGYLSKVLNAMVYDAAIETELQHATNLSAVSYALLIYI